MQSFLIISKNSTKQETAARTTVQEAGVDRLDVTIIERGESEEKKPKLSLGIEDVKNMQKKLYLKPLKGMRKAVILKEAHLLTPEAQNALLKVLEEPPANTIIILTAENEDALLPTVRSRCTIKYLGQENVVIQDTQMQEFEALLTALPEWGTGKALKQAEKLSKSKEEALLWIEKLIIITRGNLISLISQNAPNHPTVTRYHHMLVALQKTHHIIKTTNVNLRLALENLFLQIIP